MYTKYHSKYYATELTLHRASNSIDRLAASLSSAKVDLNPHQIDAALFAFRSPISNGVILADEVGLGKTIEAGIVIAQKWAERKRKMILIVPASLRKQWFTELEEKFFLKSVIMEKKSFNQYKKEGNSNPFDLNGKIIICSYHFASQMAEYVKRVNWDLVVIDEAHRLRNVYKPSNVIGNKIKDAISNRYKLLLTATPLQNSLIELYGLSIIIDDYIFGDLKSFRSQYLKINSEEIRNTLLRKRLQQFCKRTLRKQVTEYVPYTKRVSIAQEYYPSDEEQELYDKVSLYLQRDNLYALPASQRKLMTLILRKLLASSSYAIAGTLKSLIDRLNNLLDDKEIDIDVNDYEHLEEVQDEWDEDILQDNIEKLKQKDEITEELRIVSEYYKMASNINKNTKGENLLTALEKGFEKGSELGASKKAVIFTESKRTQDYLFHLLSDNGYEGKIVLMNGQNTDEVSKAVYNKWLIKHKDEDTITGSKQADMKSAIVEEFKETANILIATEAAAEGINLQFCSLVVNFDLPWNPQRIEQRIGRCHRYGQKSDVVVVNFVNKRNEADVRVYQLLAEKFKLFDGIFGASDEVLGTLESGLDFEKKIAEIYQKCRKTDEIRYAFDNIQKDLEEQIESKMEETRRSLLENFDEEVQQKLKICEETTKDRLSQYEKWLFNLIKSELGEDIEVGVEEPRFYYKGNKYRNAFYNLNWKKAEEKNDIFMRKEHPLADEIITEALSKKLDKGNIELYYSKYGNKISFYENLKSQSGWLIIDKVSYDAYEKEESLLLTAVSDAGEIFDEQMSRKLMDLPAKINESINCGEFSEVILNRQEELKKQFTHDMELRNMMYYQEECDKLDAWSDDLKQGLEMEIKELDKEIKELKKNSKTCSTLQETLSYQKLIKSTEKKRNEKRRNLFIEQDEIDKKRDELVENMEKQLKSKIQIENVFAIRWCLL